LYIRSSRRNYLGVETRSVSSVVPNTLAVREKCLYDVSLFAPIAPMSPSDRETFDRQLSYVLAKCRESIRSLEAELGLFPYLALSLKVAAQGCLL
jgi:hypothetical protein